MTEIRKTKQKTKKGWGGEFYIIKDISQEVHADYKSFS